MSLSIPAIEMNETRRLTIEERAELIAYLDGELDEESTERVEQWLSRDAHARHEANLLTRTWELLDALPKNSTSADFTVKTLASVEFDEGGLSAGNAADSPASRSRFAPASSGGRDAARQARRAGLVALWVGSLALAATIGYVSAGWWVVEDWEILSRDYPVIENIHEYKEVENVEFLRALRDSGFFHEAEQAEGDEQVVQPETDGPTDVDNQ